MKFKYLAKEKISKLPKNCGVYAFKNGSFLYIGKASNLKERVKTHFQAPTFRDNLFINQVKKVGYLETDSEIEALILEAQLIKKIKPKFNVLWKDDKNYFFVGITKEEYPRIFLTHQTKEKGKKKKAKGKTVFIGPFVDGKSLKNALFVLRKIFPFRSCKKIPNRPCLWYHLNRCPGPCLLKSLKEENIEEKIKKELKKNTQSVLSVLKGEKTSLIKKLTKEMEKLAKKQEFEKAGKLKEQLNDLEKVLSHSKIFPTLSQNSFFEDYLLIERELKKILKLKKKISRIEAYDISNLAGQQATGSMVTFIKGKPDKNFYRRFKIKISGKPNDIAMIKECLERRLGHPEWGYPDLVLIDGGKSQLNAAKKVFEKSSLKIPVIALAKKKNELFVENQKKPLLLKNLPEKVANLILQLRDEAHRFAKKYHQYLRKKHLFP